MSNMSYCRFSNTLSDLRDCAENIYEPCSAAESKARKALIELCYSIVTDFGDDEGELVTEDIAALPVQS